MRGVIVVSFLLLACTVGLIRAAERSGERSTQKTRNRAEYLQIIAFIAKMAHRFKQGKWYQAPGALIGSAPEIADILVKLNSLNNGKYDMMSIQLAASMLNDLKDLADALAQGNEYEFFCALAALSYDGVKTGVSYSFSKYLDQFKAGFKGLKCGYKAFNMARRGARSKEILIEIAPDVLQVAKYALGTELKTVITTFEVIRDLRDMIKVARDNGDLTGEILKDSGHFLDATDIATDWYEKHFAHHKRGKKNKA